MKCFNSTKRSKYNKDPLNIYYTMNIALTRDQQNKYKSTLPPR